jgi:hypothetical protein
VETDLAVYLVCLDVDPSTSLNLAIRFTAYAVAATLAAYGIWFFTPARALNSNSFFPIALVLQAVALHLAGLSSFERPIVRMLSASAAIVVTIFLAGIAGAVAGGASAALITENRWANWLAFALAYLCIFTLLVCAVWRTVVPSLPRP